MSIVPLVYLLAVDVDKLSPALNGFVWLLSEKLAASFGLVPWELSAKFIEKELNPFGAEGIALTWNVNEVSVSDCAVISGVPFAVKFKL